MKEYKRDNNLFSLCGLNCGLCPRFNTKGDSKCPGCGGTDFNLKHPSCSVITCSLKHENIEYCFDCKDYPCKKYNENSKDSFISYKNVISDFEKCKSLGINKYNDNLKNKIKVLEYLLSNYNNGRLKQFYCNAVNLLNYDDLIEILGFIKFEKKEEIDNIEINKLVSLINNKAKIKNVSLELRK